MMLEGAEEPEAEAEEIEVAEVIETGWTWAGMVDNVLSDDVVLCGVQIEAGCAVVVLVDFSMMAWVVNLSRSPG